MSLTYTTYVEQLANLMVVAPSSAPLTNPEFAAFLPGCIDYVEQRTYRELDLLYTTVISSGVLSSGSRDFQFPTYNGTYLVVDQINVITPVTAGSSNGQRNSLTPVTPDFVDWVYPSNSIATGVPQYFAMQNSSAAIMGPAPDASYAVEVKGTQRPAPLSSTNTTTILTTMLPDIMIAGSMVFASGYMRNFSAMGDNPQMAVGWEQQYKALMQSANVEELRKTFESQGWTSIQPSPIATPPRV